MKKIAAYTVLLFLTANTDVFSQKTINKDNYTSLVQKEEGDLNQDKKNDRIMVEMDLKDETRPLRLQIFLSQPDKKLQLVVSSTKIIESQYPVNKNGKHNGNVIPDFFIEEGKLKMLTDIEDRKSTYEFRLKQNNFELIKISRVLWDGKDTTFETEIDLIAKTKIEYEQVTGSDKLLNKKKKLIKVNALPKIQDLSFSDLEQY
ncbi:hypothetical protein [Chryseobacterium rhizosphaerae]|jgi:hypothetical protein|uniref:DUF4412 domain-containing protein n=1 Tax=Chryseobacterium rhizosphaerae TaxID=395937 RepID=A0ABX9IEX2_9FLAO|nr:hypothetical protein [Chryseobacterium rhizosphaerae]MDC8100517.1 hypothetical protein [Chryseobacterium rhizosphaerae]REC71148.1 hypothetical protein DRF57_21020 [Chryseobacterium rhizosphaerae]GEN67622.1 hypothetical protein CRH01_21900 [Chryseobacterium rhizosphaerae]